MDLGTKIEMKTNNALHLARLTITGGLAQRGAGVDSVGSVTLNKVTVSGNEAAMSGSAAQGGGILTQGSLSAIDSRIVDSRLIDARLVDTRIVHTGRHRSVVLQRIVRAQHRHAGRHGCL